MAAFEDWRENPSDPVVPLIGFERSMLASECVGEKSIAPPIQRGTNSWPIRTTTGNERTKSAETKGAKRAVIEKKRA